MINDLKNISLITKGDQKKFRQLMELFADELFIFAKGFIRNREVAEEIVSDIFVKIWQNRLELGKIRNLKSYLFICVKNGCLSHLRKAKSEKMISLDEFNDFHFLPVEGPKSEYIHEEIIEQIYEAIEKLPPKRKLAFSLAKINGLKHREIAEVMGVSEKTVNNHLVAAVKKITKTLEIKKKYAELQSPFKRASLFSF